jgi:hypothetical protein
MPGYIAVADTIFDHPLFSEWNPSPSTDVPVGGRLMSSSPHIDGMMASSSVAISVSPVTGVTQNVRNAEYNWSHNLATGNAGTYYFRTCPSDGRGLRIGEQYILDLQPPPTSYVPPYPVLPTKTSYPAAPAKGIQVTDLFIVLGSQTLLPTAITLRCSGLAYPLEGGASAAPVGTDILAATSVLPQAALTTLGQYQTLWVAIPTPAFVITDISTLEIEAAITATATTVMQVAALGCHYNFNYN